jgi:hypothetical protein
MSDEEATQPDPDKYPNPVQMPVDPPKIEGTEITIDEDEK